MGYKKGAVMRVNEKMLFGMARLNKVSIENMETGISFTETSETESIIFLCFKEQMNRPIGSWFR